ncbi:hypothetical protein [Bacillus toyonensis]|uniref:hypothetical protein n=1 Tax=Bacillus toyonensis TaxID=155322 RepID=UPI000BFD8462|nr:hypothetical protein [Bacillus toyonensis]PHD85522.1 hypothetical protein COF55_25345 [Bacillus toyonensis]
MQLHFESWINEQRQNISEDALVLFKESIICYRVGAYRASFLMSYLGFMKALKDRLLRSEKPDLIDDGKWSSIRKTLNDDNKWETTVFTTTQEKEKDRSKYYLISSDLMEEIPYWKKKRNECAHAKDTIISHSHIETFWLFLESNYAKFVVNGGKEALLNKIKKHFDKNFTQPNADVSYLIKEIPLVVKTHEIPELLKEIYDNYVDLDDTLSDEMEISFWSKIAYSDNNNIRNALLEFIETDTNIFSVFIGMFPDKLVEFADNQELIRNFWNELLFKRITYLSDSYWELISIVLRNGWVPSKETKRFISKVYNHFDKYSFPELEQTKIFREHGLLKLIKENIFESGKLNQRGGYQLANESSNMIIYYLDNESLDGVVIKELNQLFETLEFGRFFEKIKKYIEENPRFISDFRRVALEHQIILTGFFKEKSETNDA